MGKLGNSLFHVTANTIHVFILTAIATELALLIL